MLGHYNQHGYDTRAFITIIIEICAILLLLGIRIVSAIVIVARRRVVVIAAASTCQPCLNSCSQSHGIFRVWAVVVQQFA